ncbi:unnamed protein product [Rotaria magnacalcarata]|uniref:Uncharacterized protein n=1 Tax=Rotaria magnacalcarata TaxID=392030 RepID=A0A815V5L2_9BILA|nr:unnamed protein product [Rotaria magnacalcarata]CAF1623209.1 unnamed protein product [Rotaria magnacalcarata]CAF2037131.1 unnamed protein product [Rotaria magnacalcarata]
MNLCRAYTKSNTREQTSSSSSLKQLTECRHGSDCLTQYSDSSEHKNSYSHPCPWLDLCNNTKIEHQNQYTHIVRNIVKCKYGSTNCNKLWDPEHRSKYRHDGLPYFLNPCKYNTKCHDRSIEHLKKYKHSSSFYQEATNKGAQVFRKRGEHEQSKQAFNTRSTKYQEESDDEYSVLNFYNKDVGNSTITDAPSYDKHNNPTGRNYDLGKDGAFKDYSILIGRFYLLSEFTDEAMQIPIDALKSKGFQVTYVKSENECMTELKTNHHQIVWIISAATIENNTFTSTLTSFHSSGGAILLFADNVPYVSHASEFLQRKFGITLTGEYFGDKTLTFKENGYLQAGFYGQHEIFTGIQNLYEGITICHPVYPTTGSKSALINVATATDGSPNIALYDPPAFSTEGRLALDCGFTKLFCKWDSAGTARYIVNVSCWLLGIEKRLKSTKRDRK